MKMKFYGNRGLKNCLSEYKGSSLGCKLERLRYELTLAWERAWYGYSRSDIFNLNSHVSDQLVAMLRTFKDNPIFVLMDLDTTKGIIKELSDEEADVIYSRMIKCIEHGSDADLCYKELYGVFPHEDGYDKTFIEKYRATEDLRKTYKHEAFELLEKYWDQLWY